MEYLKNLEVHTAKYREYGVYWNESQVREIYHVYGYAWKLYNKNSIIYKTSEWLESTNWKPFGAETVQNWFLPTISP